MSSGIDVSVPPDRVREFLIRFKKAMGEELLRGPNEPDASKPIVAALFALAMSTAKDVGEDIVPWLCGLLANAAPKEAVMAQLDKMYETGAMLDNDAGKN